MPYVGPGQRVGGSLRDGAVLGREGCSDMARGGESEREVPGAVGCMTTFRCRSASADHKSTIRTRKFILTWLEISIGRFITQA
jgi:hypothetical protein